MNVPLSRKAKLNKLAFFKNGISLFAKTMFTLVKPPCSSLGNSFALPSWSFEVACLQFPVHWLGFSSTAKLGIHLGKVHALWHSFAPDQFSI
jgi:hypothetical protein